MTAPELEDEILIVNILRAPEATDDPNYVYIGRAGYGEDGYFGNPYRVGEFAFGYLTREQAIENFKIYFLARVKVDTEYRNRVLSLRGKVLGCFCKPAACHGDVIKEWVESHG